MSNWALDRLNYIKEHPQDFIDVLMQHTYERLGQKLDITREQKQMAFDQKNDLSFKYLHELENLIMEVRMIKAEEEEEKWGKQIIKKRNKKIKEIFNKPIDNEELESQGNDTENNDKYKPEQLLFDF